MSNQDQVAILQEENAQLKAEIREVLDKTSSIANLLDGMKITGSNIMFKIPILISRVKSDPELINSMTGLGELYTRLSQKYENA